MNNITLPEYIIYTDGTCILSSRYKKTVKADNQLELLLEKESQVLDLIRTPEGSLVFFGELLYCIPSNTILDDTFAYATVSQETTDEVNKLNSKSHG